MKQKKGAAHFEMIISFIFFVGFIFFMITILKPYDEQKLSYAVLEGIYDTLQEDHQTNYTRFFIKTDIPSTQTCFIIDLEQQFFHYPFTNIKVLDHEGGIPDASFQANSLHGEGIQPFSYFIISPDFATSSYTCNEGVPLTYTLGGIEEKRIFSTKSLEPLETTYYENYDTLKEQLGIPKVYDFSITAPEAELSLTRIIPDTAEVLVRDYITEMLDSNTGTIKLLKLTISVW